MNMKETGSGTVRRRPTSRTHLVLGSFSTETCFYLLSFLFCPINIKTVKLSSAQLLPISPLLASFNNLRSAFLRARLTLVTELPLFSFSVTQVQTRSLAG